MRRKILAAVAALIVMLMIVIALQPSTFRITRSEKISAPAATVFPHVNDLHKWQAWSPWENIDPALERTYEGPEEGKGASYTWKGNSDVGEGRMTITDSEPNESLRIRLDFVKPMAATNQVDFTFKPVGDQTEVTWSMDGQNGFMGKAFCLFMNMDKMLGGQFEQGLSKLKSVAEAAPHAESEPEPKEFKESDY